MPEDLQVHAAQEQQPLRGEPYDRWVSPGGGVSAEFHRTETGYCIRFPDQADFMISADLQHVACVPVPGASADVVESLYANSILPLLGNHTGSLNLHGSACVLPWGAAGFVGQSRRGKTTLAGACARAGYPFLSEDVISLVAAGDGYAVQPLRPVLRVFGDSAQFLRGEDINSADAAKVRLEAGPQLPFAHAPAPLQTVFVLGPGTATVPSFTRMGASEALAEVMQHAFVLDVEDKRSLAAHFGRLAQMTLTVPFVLLDYPRRFEHLPAVVAAVAGYEAASGAR